jgi:UDP-glucose 4-epimerase
MEGVDAVFHLAAKLHLNDPSPNLSQEYRRINADGATNVARAALNAGVKRMVHFSTISVYGPSFGHPPHTETSPLNPQSLYAETKRLSEEGIRKIFQGSSRSSSFVILRLAAVYGPRLQGNYRSLVKALRTGLFWPIGNGRNRRTMIFIDDLVRAALMAAQHPKAAGQVFNVTDGQIHTFNDVLRAMAGAMGKPPPFAYLPYKPMRTISAMTDHLTHALHLPFPKLEPLVAKMIEDVAASGEKLRHDLSFYPKYSLGEGWKMALSR